MLKYITLTTIIIALAIVNLQSQQTWQEQIGDPNANFYNIQAEAEAYYQNIPMDKRKGTGWKQYKRWEYYHEQRVDEQGNFPKPGYLLREMDQYYKSHKNPRTYAVGSGNWTALGPIAKPLNGTGQPNGNGRLLCIAFHPTDVNTIFVGAPAGGFWKSTDNGSTWTQYVAGMTRLGISSIVVHPTTPNIIYIGTGDRDGGDVGGYGVWRSTDGGLTWAPHNTGMGNRTVNELIMHPSNPNIMLAATSNNRVYRTTNGGTNWTFTGIGTNPKDIAFKPGDPNIVYAAGAQFYQSTDNGQTFTQITAGLPAATRMAIGVSANQPDWVYVFAGGATGTGSFRGIYRSTDSGLNFSTRTTTPNIMGYSTTGNDDRDQAWYDMTLAVDPTDANTLFAGSINIWKSVDGGTTMTLSAHWTGSGGADDVHADQHVMEYSPHNNNIFNGNDGGIYKTVDNGVTWTELSDGLGIAQLYKLGVAQTSENLVINGYQDNGTAVYYNGPFSTEIGGDGMECIIDPTDHNYMYGALYYGDIRRSTNAGATFGGIAGAVSESGAWVTPYKLDPNNVDRMYAGFVNMWRSDNVKAGTPTWTQISTLTGGGTIRDLAIAPSNSDVVYIARNQGSNRFYRTANATAATPTWTNLTANLPNTGTTPKDIEIDPSNPDHLFLAQGNEIYESTNGGASWTNFSGTLPNIPLNTIVIDQNSPVEAMYVGMDVGVYYRDNNMTDWVMYSTGLPNVEITELEIYANTTECKSKLFAATYGQGLQMSDLKDPGTVVPTACFETSQTTVCTGQTITLTDNSAYTPTGWAWNISPNTFNFMGGTDASTQNPQIQFTAAGSYTIELTATNTIGSDLETKTGYLTVISANIATTFNDNLEAYASCGTASDCGATSCPLAGSSWTNLVNGTDDNIDWRIDAGGTPSTSTGPSVDFDPGTSVGNYAYLEASSCSRQTAILECSCAFLDKDYDFNFAYHMLGNNVGSLFVELNDGSGWTQLFAIAGNQGTNWQIETIDLSAYTGQSVSMRIGGVTGNGFQSDIAIDGISFEPQNVLATEFTTVHAACSGNGKNTISWKSEKNDRREQFQVQKSTIELGTWEVIGEIPVSDAISYSFEDEHPLLGENLYRVVVVNPNEEKHYSKVVAANCDFDVTRFQVFPNPFNDKVSLQFTTDIKAALPFKITNLLGQLLAKGELQTSMGKNTLDLPIQDLPNGVYLLHINNKMIKLVKN